MENQEVAACERCTARTVKRQYSHMDLALTIADYFSPLEWGRLDVMLQRDDDDRQRRSYQDYSGNIRGTGRAVGTNAAVKAWEYVCRRFSA